MDRMKGKVALITGGARGQGRAHALRLASEGANIALVDITKDIDTVHYPLSTSEDLASTAKEVEALGREVVTFVGDVRSSADIDAAVAGTLEAFGQIDTLVSNAGIWALSPFWETSDAEWTDQIDVNLTGHWRVVKAVAPHMIERRRGSVVFMGSANGIRAAANYAHYCAAKHGLIGLMRTVALELGPYGVRANAVCPGVVNTKMNDWQLIYDLMGGVPEGEGTPEHRLAGAAHSTILPGRGLIEPESVAQAVLWLASDESADVTGVDLPVDSGLLTLTGFNPAPVWPVPNRP
jgi:SDR family mycofactocin-dependent oxidoreductase